MKASVLVSSLLISLLVLATSTGLAEAAPKKPGEPTLKPGFKTVQNNNWIWVELVYKNYTGPDANPSTAADNWCPDGYDYNGTVYGAEPLCDYGAPQWGYMKHVVSYNRFFGSVKATDLKPLTQYQITINGPGYNATTGKSVDGSQTDQLTASVALGKQNTTLGGWWHKVNSSADCLTVEPELDPDSLARCQVLGGYVHLDQPHDGDEGFYNIALAVSTDSAGAFTYNFDVPLPIGSYSNAKFLMKEVSNSGLSGPFTPVLMEYTRLTFTIKQR